VFGREKLLARLVSALFGKMTVIATWLCPDVLLALLTWWLASALPGTLGSEEPPAISALAVAIMGVSIATWVGERMLPGF
jgi:hypothetical protein